MRDGVWNAEWRRLSLTLLMLLTWSALFAQVQTADTTRTDSTEVKGLEYHIDEPDSLQRARVHIFRYRPMQRKIFNVEHPALDPTGAQFSDVLDALNGNYYLGKGVVGEPNYSLYPTLAADLAMRMKPDALGGYAKTPANVNLYQTQTPYSRLGYHSSLNDDYQVQITHTQNIKPGWNAAFDYHLYNPAGIYTNSGVTGHFLDANTNYFSPDSRIRAVAGIIWQSADIGENGGLADDEIFTTQTQTNRAGIPVIYDNAGTRYRTLNAYGHASYSLVRQFDRLRERDSIVIDSTGTADTLVVTDTLRAYTPRMLNLGALGIDLNYERRKRAFEDSTLWNNFEADLFWTNDVYPDHLWRNPLKVTLGVKPHITRAVITTDTLRSSAWIGPYGRAELALMRGSSLSVEAEMDQGFDGGTDHRFAAQLVMPLDSARRTLVTLSAISQHQRPDVRMLYDAARYQNMELQSVSSERFELNFRNREWVNLQVRASHMSHNVWYDSTLSVCEGNTDLWLYQAALTLRLKLGWLHLDMQQLLQHSTDSLQMPVPVLASKNSVYADLMLFHGVLRAQFGVDLRYHTAFYAPGYDPTIGVFYHQDETLIGNYLWGDVFINLQVKRASIYVKAGHLNALWETSPNYFILPHYPGQKFGVFWGLTWNFFD